MSHSIRRTGCNMYRCGIVAHEMDICARIRNWSSEANTATERYVHSSFLFAKTIHVIPRVSCTLSGDAVIQSIHLIILNTKSNWKSLTTWIAHTCTLGPNGSVPLRTSSIFPYRLIMAWVGIKNQTHNVWDELAIVTKYYSTWWRSARSGRMRSCSKKDTFILPPPAIVSAD